MKASAVFVDLIAPYDIVWQRSLTDKLLRLHPGRHMVLLIIKFVCNRSFTLTTGAEKQTGYDALRMASVKD